MSSCNSRPSKGTRGKQADSCSTQNNKYNKTRHVIGVMSDKGGIGKSSMNVPMAKEMARGGFRTGIMSVDITRPSTSRLMGPEHAQAFGTNDVTEPVVDKDGVKVMSLNFLVGGENQPVIWHGPIIANAVEQFRADVAWEELDCLFADMPPGIGSVALTVLQSLPVNGVIMVSTPQSMVSMIVSKAIDMCKQAKIEVSGIIENMSYAVRPDCGKRIKIFQHRNVEDFVRGSEVFLRTGLLMMDNTSRIYKDDGFDTETAQQMYAWISPAADRLIEKTGK